MSDRPSKSPAVAHAAAMLRFLASADRPQSLAAVSRAVSVSPSSCHNILRTLVAEDLATFDEDDKTYALGGGIVRLARHALDPDNAYPLARQALRRLARDHDVTAALWRAVEGDRVVLLGFESPERDMRLHMTVGQRLPLLSGAVGRILAVGAGAGRLEMLFGRVRWENAPDFAEYVRDVDAAQVRGWSIDEGRFRRGVTTVAANAGARSGLVVSASLLGVHHDEAALGALGAELAATGERIAVLQGA